ncbi:glycosyltransferase [Granulosicoccus sp. 3-233]|uniref:glycosyltransferase n=1 Tax=Granulosicoccus sp. 3-233 TaxID=3417969 RepID=UPI003D335296
MRYSVIIPAWNEAAFIADTLEKVTLAIRALEAGSEHRGELIVVDNNSSDDTGLIAQEQGAQVVFEPINQIARARNRGAMAATGDALVFLDADTSCSEQLLRQALDRLASGGVVGGGSLIAADRPVSASAMRGLRFWNTLSLSAGLAAGCFIFCRRDAFDAVGGFSNRVYAGEEIFLSRGLKRWGRRSGMRFEILTTDPVVTSVRKLDWYSTPQLIRQTLLVLIPGAVFSRRLCGTWYDDKKHGRMQP